LPGFGTALHLWHFRAPGFGVGFGAGFGVVSVGFGVGFCVGLVVGFGVGFGVGFVVGFGEGFGVDGKVPSCMLQPTELQRQTATLAIPPLMLYSLQTSPLPSGFGSLSGCWTLL